jgi:hypothetical protein
MALLPRPQNRRECHLYFAEGCHLYIAATGWPRESTILASIRRTRFCTLCPVSEPLAYLTDVLQRIVSGRSKNHELHALLPWNWRSPATIATAFTATTVYRSAPLPGQSDAAVVTARRSDVRFQGVRRVIAIPLVARVSW